MVSHALCDAAILIYAVSKSTPLKQLQGETIKLNWTGRHDEVSRASDIKGSFPKDTSFL